jgi:hypothetical protein
LKRGPSLEYQTTNYFYLLITPQKMRTTTEQNKAQYSAQAKPEQKTI